MSPQGVVSVKRTLDAAALRQQPTYSAQDGVEVKNGVEVGLPRISTEAIDK